jgi:hypothetical protein
MRTDGQTDRRTDMSKLTDAFRDYANAPNKDNEIELLGMWFNNIYLTAIGLSPGGSGYLTCIQI